MLMHQPPPGWTLVGFTGCVGRHVFGWTEAIPQRIAGRYQHVHANRRVVDSLREWGLHSRSESTTLPWRSVRLPRGRTAALALDAGTQAGEQDRLGGGSWPRGGRDRRGWSFRRGSGFLDGGRLGGRRLGGG